MVALELLSAFCLLAGTSVLASEDSNAQDRPLPAAWDTLLSCGKAHLGCQMGVECACHYFKDCNPDGSYTGPMLDGVDKCLCEYGWSAYCPANADAPVEKRANAKTISIVDEHPGHRTLNHANADEEITKVTIVTNHGSVETLIPVTNAAGHVVLSTKGVEEHHKHPAQKKHGAGHTDTTTAPRVADDVNTMTIQQNKPDLKAATTPKDDAPHYDPVRVADDAKTMTLKDNKPDLKAATTPKVKAPHYDPVVVDRVRFSTVTKVVTETFTKMVHRHGHYQMDEAVTVADFGDGPVVPITSDRQLIHNNTVVRVIAQRPTAKLVPVNYDEFKERFGQLSTFTLKTDRHPYAATKTVVDLGRFRFTMSQPTETHDGKVFVNDRLNKYRMYDPFHNAAVPTGSCERPANGSHHDKGECKVEKCMWNSFMKPMTITTAAPMMMMNKHGMPMMMDYFTHTTELFAPHWGVKTSKGLYFPTTRTYAPLENGTETFRVVRALPFHLRDPTNHTNDHNKHAHIHGDPVCHDLESCESYCQKHAGDDDDFNWFLLLIPLLAALILGLLCCLCCCFCWRKRNKNDDRKSSVSTLKEKLRRQSSVAPQATATPVVVEQVVNEGTGPASGAEAAREEKKQGAGDGADGRGTAARRAEEGRGRVNFEDGGAPGGGQQQVVTSSPQGAEQPVPVEQHTEVQHTDGAREIFTGRQVADTGSLRGRKPARPF